MGIFFHVSISGFGEENEYDICLGVFSVNDDWKSIGIILTSYQLFTCRIVSPVSCAKDRFCSSDGYGCYWRKRKKSNLMSNYTIKTHVIYE